MKLHHAILGGALAVAAATAPATAADVKGAGATFPFPGLFEVGRSLQEGNRHRRELPVERVGREVIEFGPTSRIFVTPREKRTVNHVIGRFG